MVLIAMNQNNAQLGGPLTTPYMAHDVINQDDLYDVLFLNSNVLGSIQGNTVDVEQQTSTWNVLFTSWWYRTYVWMLIGLNLLLALIGLGDIMRAAYQVTFHADVSALLITCSFLGASAAGAMLFFYRTSQLYVLLEMVANALSMAAFLLMVLLWSRFLMRFDKKRLNLRPLKAVVYIAMLGLVLDMSTFVSWLLVPPNASNAFTLYTTAIRFASAATLVAVGVVFLAFLVLYRPFRPAEKSKIHASIQRVGVLIAGCFLTIILQTVLLFVFQLDAMTRLPPLYLTLTMLKDLLLTGRISICLYIVRWRLAPPTEKTCPADMDGQPSLLVDTDVLEATYPHLSARNSRADSYRWSAQTRLPSHARTSTLQVD
jgi:hypothetical protein